MMPKTGGFSLPNEAHNMGNEPHQARHSSRSISWHLALSIRSRILSITKIVKPKIGYNSRMKIPNPGQLLLILNL